MRRLAVLGLTACVGPTSAPPPRAPPVLTVWGAIGEPDGDRAVLWARTSGPAWVQGVVHSDSGVDVWSAVHATDAAHDFAVSLPVDGLTQAERLRWTVRAVPKSAGLAPVSIGEGAGTASGSARPIPHDNVLRVAIVGDLGGQGYCAPPGGYSVLDAVRRRAPHVLVANGDMIYADGTCPPHAPDGQTNRPGAFRSVADPRVDWTDRGALDALYFAHWRYNWGDRAMQELLASTFYVGQWDDHEVINDFGAAWSAWHTKDPYRPGFSTLVDAGRGAFWAYTPHRDGPIHRQLDWGPTAALFVLDARSFRDNNAQPDGPDKTLLGLDQRGWVAKGVAASTAHWKLLSLDVPLSVPTGSTPWQSGRDGVASGDGDPAAAGPDISAQTGFEAELSALLATWDRQDIDGLVFVTTDVHFARVTRYAHDFDGDGEPLVFHEVIAGPLRAWMGEPVPADPSFGPTVLFEAGLVQNFAILDVGEDELAVEIVGADGGSLGVRTIVRAPSR